MKKCQQNIEPIGDLLEQQIHIAIVPSFTEWVEMFFEVAFLKIDLLGSSLHTTTSMVTAQYIADKDSPK